MRTTSLLSTIKPSLHANCTRQEYGREWTAQSIGNHQCPSAPPRSYFLSCFTAEKDANVNGRWVKLILKGLLWQYQLQQTNLFHHLLRLAVTDAQSPGLVVQAIWARHQLPVRARPGKPRFEVELLGRSVIQRARHYVDDAVADAQILRETAH